MTLRVCERVSELGLRPTNNYLGHTEMETRPLFKVRVIRKTGEVEDWPTEGAKNENSRIALSESVPIILKMV